MAQVDGRVLGLHQRRDHLEDVEVLGKLDKFPKVLGGAGAAAPLEVCGMGRARAGLEDEIA